MILSKWYYQFVSVPNPTFSSHRNDQTRTNRNKLNKIVSFTFLHLLGAIKFIAISRPGIHWRICPRTTHSFNQLSLGIIFSFFHQRWNHIYIGPKLSINESGLALLMNWVVHYPSRFSGRCWWTRWTDSFTILFKLMKNQSFYNDRSLNTIDHIKLDRLRLYLIVSHCIYDLYKNPYFI